MKEFVAQCGKCHHPMTFPVSKQGAHINCPECGHLQRVGRAKDVAFFWGGTLGCYGTLALLLAVGVVWGLVVSNPVLWISSAVLLVVLTVVLLIVLAAS